MHPQLVLSLDAAPATTFDSFRADAELDAGLSVARHAVEAFAAGTLDERQLFLWGANGSGKSHLLVAACHSVREAGYLAAYVPGDNANVGDALDGYEDFALLCIDDLQRLQPASERDLYRCINRCHESGTRLLFASDRPIDALRLTLTDLVSRLTWGPVFRLEPPCERARLDAVRAEFRLRSVEPGEDVPAWLLRRHPDDLDAVKALVRRLAEASLSERKRITVAFARRIDDEPA